MYSMFIIVHLHLLHSCVFITRIRGKGLDWNSVFIKRGCYAGIGMEKSLPAFAVHKQYGGKAEREEKENL